MCCSPLWSRAFETIAYSPHLASLQLIKLVLQWNFISEFYHKDSFKYRDLSDRQDDWGGGGTPVPGSFPGLWSQVHSWGVPPPPPSRTECALPPGTGYAAGSMSRAVSRRRTFLYYIISGVYLKEVRQHGIITERLFDVHRLWNVSTVWNQPIGISGTTGCPVSQETIHNQTISVQLLSDLDSPQNGKPHSYSHLWLIHKSTLGILFFLLEVRLQRLESMYTVTNHSACVKNSQAAPNAEMNQTVTTDRKDVVSRQMHNDFLFLCMAYILLVCIGTLLFQASAPLDGIYVTVIRVIYNCHIGKKSWYFTTGWKW